MEQIQSRMRLWREQKSTSYYADYMAGLDIEIDGLTINKTTFKEATLVESNVNIVDEAPYGLYFVKPGAILTYSCHEFRKCSKSLDSNWG